MALINIETKTVGDSDPNKRKILATDVNQIKGALQSGTYDIKPADIKTEGTLIYLNGSTVGIRYNTGTSKMQVSHDGASWGDIGSAGAETTLSVTAGENVAIRDLVYMDPSDGKVYKCDADDLTKIEWLGTMNEAVLQNNSGDCNITGSIVGGFAALDEGEWYEVSSTSGEVSKGNSNPVGIALSSSTIKLIKTRLKTLSKVIDHTDMDGQTSVTIFSLPARGVLTDVHLSVDTAFDTDTKGNIGISTDEDKYITIQSLDSTGLKGEPTDTGKEMLSTSAATDIKLYFAGAWTSGGNLGTARQALAGAGTLAAGLCFGGNSGAASNVTEEYNGTAWSGGGNLGTARERLAGAGTQSAGLSFGGWTGANSAVTEEYDGAAWAGGGNLNTARRYLAGCGTQSAGLSMGGLDGGGYSVVTEEYNGAAWAGGGNLNNARDSLGGLGTQSAGLCYGGADGGGNSNKTEEYDGAAWANSGNLNTARAGIAGAGTQTDGMSFGGTTGAPSAVTELYDGAAWTATTSMTTARQYLCGGGDTSAAFSAGGYTGSLSNVTEEYADSWSLTQGSLTVFYNYNAY